MRCYELANDEILGELRSMSLMLVCWLGFVWGGHNQLPSGQLRIPRSPCAKSVNME